VTVAAYGNRLHGDERGSVDGRNNLFGEPDLAPDHDREAAERAEMAWPPLRFSAAARRAIERAFSEVCAHRGWTIHACHARTTHVHTVITAEASTAKVLHDLKAVATRRLREAGIVPPRRPVWAEHGSTVYLWSDKDVIEASRYSVHGQGSRLLGSLRPGPWLNHTESEEPQ
jgi:REP element-mobilizing transposase RayT